MTTFAASPFNLRPPLPMIAVTFALPQESRPFRSALRHAGRSGVPPDEYLLGNFGDEEVIVLHTGIGEAAATARTGQLLAQVQPRCLLAAGFAGGLDARLRTGELVIATNVTQPALRERARALFGSEAGVAFGPLIGAPLPVEDVATKAALHRSTGALAVDMETAALAAASARARVPFLAVRAISDPAGEPLPVPFAEWFDLEKQRPRPLALLCFLRRHPGRIIPFMRFVHGLGPASAALREFLVRFITAASPSSSS